MLSEIREMMLWSKYCLYANYAKCHWVLLYYSTRMFKDEKYWKDFASPPLSPDSSFCSACVYTLLLRQDTSSSGTSLMRRNHGPCKLLTWRQGSYRLQNSLLCHFIMSVYIVLFTYIKDSVSMHFRRSSTHWLLAVSIPQDLSMRSDSSIHSSEPLQQLLYSY